MNKTFSLVALCSALIVLSMPAAATDLPGYGCDKVGTTKLSQTQDTLIACLNVSSTDSTPIWKPMTPLVSDAANNLTAPQTLTAKNLTAAIDSGTPVIQLKTNGKGIGIGATSHVIFGPYDSSGGDPGALYIGTGRRASDNARNDIVFYNWACSNGTCNVPNIYLYADTTQANGNITATGGIKPGWTATCSGGFAGMIRWNGQMEYCNGGAWVALGGASGNAVNMYQCPVVSGGALGGGAWGYYGCQGQITNMTYCGTIEFPKSRTDGCTYVGKMMLQP